MSNTDRVAQNFDGTEMPSQPRRQTPDISDLVLRSLIDYCRSRGFSASEARQKAGELMNFIEREAEKFT